MIRTNEEIIELIKKTFISPIVKNDGWHNEVIVKFKGSANQCTFDFREFNDDDKYCAEFFKGHLCLSFGFDYNNHNGGIGYMSVADEEDMSEEIISFIENYLKVSRRKEEEIKYQQLSIFDFNY